MTNAEVRALLEEAGELGARRALARLGLADEAAREDVTELRHYRGVASGGSSIGAGGGDYATGSGSPVKAMLSGGPLAGLADLTGVLRSGVASAGTHQ